MKAYHGDQAVKDKYLGRVRAHRAADEIVKGQYWQNGKGCAVGCTVHSSRHSDYENELGIPRILARIEDGIFEGMPNEISMTWPERFLEAVPVGADLSGVSDLFLHWLLVDPEHGVIRFAADEKNRAAIQHVADLYARRIKGEVISPEMWQQARTGAWRYYWADAADAADARWAADAADAAAAAADARWAADAAAADADAADARWNKKYAEARVVQSEKLLELLRAAPIAVAA